MFFLLGLLRLECVMKILWYWIEKKFKLGLNPYHTVDNLQLCPSQMIQRPQFFCAANVSSGLCSIEAFDKASVLQSLVGLTLSQSVLQHVSL